MDWIDIIDFAGVIAGFTVSVMGLVLAFFSSYLDRYNKRFILLFFSFLTAYTASDAVSQVSLMFMGPDHALLSKIAIFGESFFSSLLMPLLTFFILFYSGKKHTRDPYFKTVVALWAAYVILLVITQFTSGIYYITEDNVYHRGPYYPVLLMPAALIMIINLLALLSNRKVLSRRQMQAFLTYILLPLVCILIQMCFYGLLMVVIGSAIASMLMFAFIVREETTKYIEQLEKDARLRENIASQRVSIMVLQMRPHFIYNTLTSIYYLCSKDPEKAKTIIMDFTKYLRKNFTAVGKEGTVSITEELEHTKAYLAVEKARFENSLFVEFDTPGDIVFEIPPLTLQPIVENSVKHGLDPELEAFNIAVHIRETEDGNEVIVEDNGTGIKENDDPHTALENISFRLKVMCGGTLTIGSREGGGTVTKVFIPRKETPAVSEESSR